MTTIANYYKYAGLATAAYVKMGNESLSGQRFSDLARDQHGAPGVRVSIIFIDAHNQALRPGRRPVQQSRSIRRSTPWPTP